MPSWQWDGPSAAWGTSTYSQSKEDLEIILPIAPTMIILAALIICRAMTRPCQSGLHSHRHWPRPQTLSLSAPVWPSSCSTPMAHDAPDGIVCLTGGRAAAGTSMSMPALLNRSMVLGNDVVFGSVNANRRHYELGADALAKADHDCHEQAQGGTLPRPPSG